MGWWPRRQAQKTGEFLPPCLKAAKRDKIAWCAQSVSFFFPLYIYTSLCCCKLCFWYFDDWQCACVMSGLLFGISFPLSLYGSNYGKVLNENENLEGKKENLKKNNINDKPLKRLPFIQTPLSAWGHWEQGNHGSLRSSSDLREPTQLSHRPANYSLGKISWRSVQQERAGCSALWNLPRTWSVLCWGWWGGQAVVIYCGKLSLPQESPGAPGWPQTEGCELPRAGTSSVLCLFCI